MKTLCQPDEEGICTQCGRPAPADRAINCPAKAGHASAAQSPNGSQRPKPKIHRTDCIHLDLTDEVGVTRPSNCGCPGNWSGLYACDLHGAVAPLCRSADSTVKSCRNCEDYVPGESI